MASVTDWRSTTLSKARPHSPLWPTEGGRIPQPYPENFH
jgi:hypothetical protein